MSSPINIVNFEVKLSLPEVNELQVHIMDDLADDLFIRGMSMESLCGLARIWALGAGQLGAGAGKRTLGELLLWKQCG